MSHTEYIYKGVFILESLTSMNSNQTILNPSNTYVFLWSEQHAESESIKEYITDRRRNGTLHNVKTLQMDDHNIRDMALSSTSVTITDIPSVIEVSQQPDSNIHRNVLAGNVLERWLHGIHYTMIQDRMGEFADTRSELNAHHEARFEQDKTLTEIVEHMRERVGDRNRGMDQRLKKQAEVHERMAPKKAKEPVTSNSVYRDKDQVTEDAFYGLTSSASGIAACRQVN